MMVSESVAEMRVPPLEDAADETGETAHEFVSFFLLVCRPDRDEGLLLGDLHTQGAKHGNHVHGISG